MTESGKASSGRERCRALGEGRCQLVFGVRQRCCDVWLCRQAGREVGRGVSLVVTHCGPGRDKWSQCCYCLEDPASATPMLDSLLTSSSPIYPWLTGGVFSALLPWLMEHKSTPPVPRSPLRIMPRLTVRPTLWTDLCTNGPPQSFLSAVCVTQEE